MRAAAAGAERPRSLAMLDDVLGGFVAAILFAYLAYVLARPEKF